LATALIAIAVFTAKYFSIDISSLTIIVIQTIVGFVSLFDKEDTHMDKKQIGLVGVAFGVDAFCWRIRVNANAVGSNPTCLVILEIT